MLSCLLVVVVVVAGLGRLSVIVLVFMRSGPKCTTSNFDKSLPHTHSPVLLLFAKVHIVFSPSVAHVRLTLEQEREAGE